ncbi:uncharacterized protein LOC127507759 [Ctenopharyngodon idella]|uniref:uncharacterized protein LOC127507759 n=1 Tax=Ctenopharyngodon idella TaxID=7959 RepID=UPI00222ED351|nr:uncharacterized protein LOC127507759 [Ctenopharyngodon idella]
MTSADEGTGTEEWLLDTSEKESIPTQAYPVSSPSSPFKDSIMNDMDLFFSLICLDCALLTIILPRLISPSSQSSASPPAPPLLEACSPAPSLEMPCRDVEPQAAQPSAAPEPEDPAAPPPVSVSLVPSWPVDLSAPSWLLPTLAPPGTLSLVTPPGSLVPPAPPWSVDAQLKPQTYGPSAMLRPSSPSAAAGSFLPSGSPLSSVSSPQSSGTLSPPMTLVVTTSPGSPAPAMLLSIIDPPSAPSDPGLSSPLVLPQMSAATPTASWLFTPSWAVGSGKLWVCAIGTPPPSTSGSRRPTITIPLSHRPSITITSPHSIPSPSPHSRPPPKPPPSAITLLRREDAPCQEGALRHVLFSLISVFMDLLFVFACSHLPPLISHHGHTNSFITAVHCLSIITVYLCSCLRSVRCPDTLMCCVHYPCLFGLLPVVL